MMNPLREKPEHKGYLALVLHAHLPYIRHHDRDDYMEERWFYEAMTETYLPLLDVFDKLVQDGVDFRLTISMTPTLLALCSDPLMQQRFDMHLGRLIELADKEQTRLHNDPTFLPLARMYAERFRSLRLIYHSCEQNIVSRFKLYQDMGKIEIITSAATHAFLPLLKYEESIKAQIATAVHDYERHFDRAPRGIWLPECGFTPGVDRILKQYGIDFFISDTSAVQFATPRANRDVYAPLMTPYGVSAFPRDPESSQQVWSATDGYPGDYNYREYYRDIGWDLGWNNLDDWEYIRPYVLPTHERVNTGIKYYRITSKGLHREPYNPDWAKERAAEHAGNFLFNREKQAEHWYYHMDRKPIIVSPYDAELFGHWWYEGPMWIDFLCRKCFYDQSTIKMVTPSEYLQEYPVADTGKLNESSWGRNHSADVWLQGNNDWIYRHLHQAEERMIQLATRHEHLRSTPTMNASLLKRALQQAAREFMLAQSSDWAFIMDAQTVVDYAIKRTKDHLGCFHQLCQMVESQQIDESFLVQLEEKHNLFPEMDYRVYARVLQTSPVSIIPGAAELDNILSETAGQPNIFMLSWEYPPKHVGGLSRAVCELSEALAAKGEIVHVITSSYYGAPYFEKKNGVYIHRLPILTSGDTDFFHWIFEMNLAMVDHLVNWASAGGRIDLIHAHDWMVYQTAREIKLSFGIPLIATIHATEWGRNQGNLYTDMQQHIHHIEYELTYEADRVFVCSQYMKNEVQRIFQLSDAKVTIVPNGIHLPKHRPEEQQRSRNQFVAPDEQMILSVGRLVYEKGFQTLIEAMPRILASVPTAKLIIAGSGANEAQLRQQAAHLGDRVMFTGFVDDLTKEQLYLSSDICVIPSWYEPFGIVALEAMKYHKPAVVSDTGGLAEIIDHGIHGYKALPGHVESLAWHISELLLNPQLGEKMADEAYLKLRNMYQWEQIAAQVQTTYHNLTYYQETMYTHPVPTS